MLTHKKYFYQAPFAVILRLRSAYILASFSNSSNLDDFDNGGELDSEVDSNP